MNIYEEKVKECMLSLAHTELYLSCTNYNRPCHEKTCIQCKARSSLLSYYRDYS